MGNRLRLLWLLRYKLCLFLILVVLILLCPPNVAELISLFMTVPTVILGLGVVRKWGYRALFILAKPAKERTKVEWLVLGVFIGFAGLVPDNGWWGVAWTMHFLDSPHRDWWFDNGVYSNIIFRQAAGVYSAYCHLQSSVHEEDRQSLNEFRMYSSLSFFMAVFYILWLLSVSAK